MGQIIGKTGNVPQTPVYDEVVQAKSNDKQPAELGELEMSANVCYGPLNPRKLHT